MKIRKFAMAIQLIFISFSLNADEISLTISIELLSSDLANKMVSTAVEDCTKKGYKVSASVVGRDGNLIAFLRNPLSGPHTIEVSRKKAYSSASLQIATSAMKARTDLNFAPGILLITGGVPISIAGKFYGGIAVAGATPEVDEECAKAGISTVEEILEFAD